MSAENDDLLERLRLVLRDEPRVRLGVLFGSFAKGCARADSDVDVAILPSEFGLDHEAEADLQLRLSLAVHRDVDLVRIERASTMLRWQIVRYGRLIHASTRADWIHFVTRTASEHADFRPVFERHAEVYRQRIASGRGWS